MTMEQLKISDIVVLLVEPSAIQQKIISRHLNDLGITQITSKASAQEALHDLTISTPDVVISALYLPDMTGTDLVMHMRQDETTQDIAFMLISSETKLDYLEPIRQAGAIAILPKPFDAQELRVAMQNTLEFIDPQREQLDQHLLEDLDVLIVDDSSLSRKHIMRVLNAMGFEKFTEASDGQHALDILTSQYFDLVVTDYNMPNMDGQELIEHIRHSSSQSSIPIMMVTSEENENRLAAVQQSGVSAICDKPFGIETVRSIVQHMFC